MLKWLYTGLFLFFAAPLFSQESTVCVKPSTARYYLEIEDEAYILREKDSISNQIIYTQSEQLLVKDKIIYTHEQSEILYQQRDTAYVKHLDFVRGALEEATDEVKKQKTLKWLGVILGIILAIAL